MSNVVYVKHFTNSEDLNQIKIVYKARMYKGKHISAGDEIHVTRYKNPGATIDVILENAKAEAQGIYDTWMEWIDSMEIKPDKQLAELESEVRSEVRTKHTIELLKERGTTHGEYGAQATTHDNLLCVMMDTPNFMKLKPAHRQALNMIVMKISRILHGNPEFRDHYKDIAGYATLGENACPPEEDTRQGKLFLSVLLALVLVSIPGVAEAKGGHGGHGHHSHHSSRSAHTRPSHPVESRIKPAPKAQEDHKAVTTPSPSNFWLWALLFGSNHNHNDEDNKTEKKK